MSETAGTITDLLRRWRAGDPAAEAAAVERVYGELRRLASARLRHERAGHTLQTTALVHELYIRLAESNDIDWASRAHFMGVAARAMRNLLVDHARRRQAHLDETCASHPELRAEVERLLGCHDRSDGFMAAPLLRLRAMEWDWAEGEERSPAFLGPYRLVRELGRGGMGTVYLAERAHAGYRRQVAVKVLHPWAGHVAGAGRFFQERQILADLKHPGIAVLLESGDATDEGVPYFVMEYVEGEPIDAFCEGRGLDMRARLELFLGVCSAVQYAHQHLVVHRDIKPSNILVTPTGAPKLLDFGISKQLPSAEAGEAPATRAELAALTPEYASPEQIMGTRITVATDVYSLGVLLYKLLTGRRPYDFSQGTLEEYVAVICHREPPPPSQAVLRPRGRQLAGDIDHIVLKALRKDPLARYPSVDHLAQDIRRYLEGEPVLARQGSSVYRLAKLVRRRRKEVAAATVCALALGAFAVERDLRQRRASLERDLAQAEREKLLMTTEFLHGMFRTSSPRAGGAVTARELLDRGARTIARLKDTPAVQAAHMNVLAKAYRDLALYAEARPLFEEALAIRRRLGGAGGLDAAESEHELGVLLKLQGRFPEAEEHLRRALAAREGVAPDGILAAATLNELAAVHQVQGRQAEAEALYQRALSARERALGGRHSDVAETLNDLALLYVQSGRLPEADRSYERALAIGRDTLGHGHPKLAIIMSNLAELNREQGRYAKAESLYRDALAIKEQAFGSDHPEVGGPLYGMALLCIIQGRYGEAEALFQRTLSIARTLPAGHPYVALALTGLARVSIAQGDAARGIGLIQEALPILRRAYPQGHWRTAYGESIEGACLTSLGRYQEAEPLLLRGHAALQKSGGRALYAKDAREWLVAHYRQRGWPAPAVRYEPREREQGHGDR